MHYPELQKLIEGGTVQAGDTLWIADYRHQSINDKPIRHLVPTEVRLISNVDLPPHKRIYYADFHFRPYGKTGKLLAQIIAPYDNTGYRGYTGGSVGVFFTREEAVAYYLDQCQEVKTAILKGAKAAQDRFDKMLSEVDEQADVFSH